jgi:hypothetical protein
LCGIPLMIGNNLLKKSAASVPQRARATVVLGGLACAFGALCIFGVLFRLLLFREHASGANLCGWGVGEGRTREEGARERERERERERGKRKENKNVSRTKRGLEKYNSM